MPPQPAHRLNSQFAAFGKVFPDQAIGGSVQPTHPEMIGMRNTIL